MRLLTKNESMLLWSADVLNILKGRISMYYSLALFLILVTVLFHELGHLIAMRMSGIWVSELGIGLPFGPSLGMTWKSKVDQKKTFRISIYPLLLGAFVRSEESEMRKSYKTNAFVCGAGIIGNLVYIALSIALIGALLPDDKVITTAFGTITPLRMIVCGLAGALGLVVLAKPITRYLFPPLSLVIFGLVIMAFYKITGQQFVENSGGMIVLGQMAGQYTKNLIDVLFFGMLVSYLLALTNLIPLYPLDGGQTIKYLVDKYTPRASKVFDKTGLYCVITLTVIALLGDVRRLYLLF